MLDRYPLTWNRTGPHPRPAAPSIPFREDGAGELNRFRSPVELPVDVGAHAAIPSGGTAEPWVIEQDERAAPFEAAVAQAAGRVPWWPGSAGRRRSATRLEAGVLSAEKVRVTA